MEKSYQILRARMSPAAQAAAEKTYRTWLLWISDEEVQRIAKRFLDGTYAPTAKKGETTARDTSTP